jgi:hypothetical protein
MLLSGLQLFAIYKRYIAICRLSRFDYRLWGYNRDGRSPGGGVPGPGDGGNHYRVDRDARGHNPRRAVASSPVALPDGATSLASLTVSRPAQHPQSSSGIPSLNQHRSMAARFNTWMPGRASSMSMYDRDSSDRAWARFFSAPSCVWHRAARPARLRRGRSLRGLLRGWFYPSCRPLWRSRRPCRTRLQAQGPWRA